MTKTNKVKTKYPKGGNKPRLTAGAKTKAWATECKRGRSWFYGLAFLLLWTFCSWTYGDVFYMAEQNSYFAFDGVIMKNITDMWDGWLIDTGRFLLLSFHYPCLGGLLMALLLTAVAWCLECLFVRRAKWLPLVLVPSVAYLFVLASRGLNLYYKSEPGYVFVWPLLACIVLGVAVMVVRLFRKNSFNYIMLGKDCLRSCCVVALLIAILCSYVFVEQENTCATAKMERQMEQENWDGMIATALGCKQPSRSVACYYAIALMQTDRITTNLFDIPFQYPDMNLKDRVGKYDNGVDYYAADGDFFAGLLNTSYHESMENMVIDGPTVKRCKRMFLCALLNGETSLAEKYLHLVSCVPFENGFVEKYKKMVADSELMKSDANLAKVAELQPVQDSFEQDYRTPYFIGYNVAAMSGRSERALKNSMVACLYAKFLPDFCSRLSGMSGQPLTSNFEEAALLFSMKNAQFAKLFKPNPLTVQRVKQMMNEAGQYQGMDKKDVARKLWPASRSSYPYYYFYGNLPEKSKSEASEEKGGVN